MAAFGLGEMARRRDGAPARRRAGETARSAALACLDRFCCRRLRLAPVELAAGQLDS